MYMSGLRMVHVLAAQIAYNSQAGTSQSVSRLVKQADHWAMWMGLVGVAGGGVLFTVTLTLGRWVRNRWQNSQFEAKAEADSRAHRLLAQLADSRVSEEE